jgi:hypothetical protein
MNNLKEGYLLTERLPNADVIAECVVVSIETGIGKSIRERSIIRKKSALLEHGEKLDCDDKGMV